MPFSVTTSGALAGSWIEAEHADTQANSTTQDAGVTSNGLTHCRTWPAQQRAFLKHNDSFQATMERQEQRQQGKEGQYVVQKKNS